MAGSQSESQAEKLPHPVECHQILTRSNKTICDYSPLTVEKLSARAQESGPRPYCEERLEPGPQSPESEAQNTRSIKKDLNAKKKKKKKR